MSKRLSVLSIIGARPQFIKAAPFSRALRQKHDEYLVHTGQHYDDAMSQIFFEQLDIPAPDVNLDVGSDSHARQTAAMMTSLETLMQEQKPDIVLVYGDTNSTLAGALAAAKLTIPIAHVEAGLRSYNRTMPEEINRVLTDHVSQWLFCPTSVALANLAREGITEGVTITGDIMVDAVLSNVERARTTSRIHQTLGINPDAPYALATIHRPVNADDYDTMQDIMQALQGLDMPVVFPVHPRTRKMIQSLPIAITDKLQLIEPLGYLDMLVLLDKACVAITDSGGLQKEAYVLQTPCVTVRSETEWVETVESGWNRLVAPQQQAIQAAVIKAQSNHPTIHPDYYGDGTAANRMVAALEM